MATLWRKGVPAQGSEFRGTWTPQDPAVQQSIPAPGTATPANLSGRSFSASTAPGIAPPRITTETPPPTVGPPPTTSPAASFVAPPPPPSVPTPVVTPAPAKPVSQKAPAAPKPPAAPRPPLAQGLRAAMLAALRGSKPFSAAEVNRGYRKLK